MQVPTPHKVTTTPLHRRRAWAFAAAFVLTVAAVGIAVLALRGDNSLVDDAPSVTAVAGQSSDVISLDSITWTRINLGTEGPGLHITTGGPELVAIGVYHEPDPNDLADGGGGPGWVQGNLDLPTVWTSPDGHEWSRVPDSEKAFGGEVEIADVAGGEDGFVAVAGNRAWVSPDGISWSSASSDGFGPRDELVGVIAGETGYVAFGGDGSLLRAAIWNSPDGYAWTRVPDDPKVFDTDIHAMTAGAPGLVAVGSSHGDCGPVIMTSPDGYSWTRLTLDPTIFGNDPSCDRFGPPQARILNVATGGPGLVAVGSYMAQATVWTSPDGATWTRLSGDPAPIAVPGHMPFAEMTSIAAVGEGLVAVGHKGDRAAVWTSLDGLTWTDITDEFDLTDNALMIEVIAGGFGVVILGEDLIEDYADHRPPLIETVMWVGSTSN